MDGLPFPAPLIEYGAGSFLLRSLGFLSVVDEGAVELVLHSFNVDRVGCCCLEGERWDVYL